MGRINIEIPEEVHRKMKSVCALSSQTLQEYIHKALEEKLRKEKR